MAKFLVFGAGRMARAIVWELSQWKYTESITIASRDVSKARAIAKFVKKKNIKLVRLDIKDRQHILSILSRHDVAISAIPYTHNYYLSSAAIASKCHFVDLGGNNEVVKKQFSLSHKAKKQRVSIVPDAGLAPGLASTLVKAGIEEFEKIRDIKEVKIRVGGLPQKPKGPLNYMLVFSPNGLINEYKEQAIVLSKGKIKKINSMENIERIHFPKYGWLEAFTTSGGTSTMPNTFKGLIKEFDYKTIRFPGHAEKIKTLFDLGFASEKSTIVDGVPVKPRHVLEKVLLNNISYEGKDLVLARVMLKGNKKRVIFELKDVERKGLSAMMRCTGFPAAIIAKMLADKTIKTRGTLKHELDIPHEPIIKGLKRRGIQIDKKISLR